MAPDTRMRLIRIAAPLFLIWNLLGIFAFVAQSWMAFPGLSQIDPYQASLMPRWLWMLYALAIAASTVGAVALMRRRRSALLLSAIGLLAFLVQFIWVFFASDLLAARGPSGALLPIAIAVIAAAQLLYARFLRRKRMLY